MGRDRLRQREERPVGERVAVDQEELARLAFAAPCPSPALVTWPASGPLSRANNASYGACEEALPSSPRIDRRLARVVHELAVRKPHDLKPCDWRSASRARSRSKASARPVEPKPVGFHHQTLVPPEEVDLEAADLCVHAGWGSRWRRQRRRKAPLELTAGEGGFRIGGSRGPVRGRPRRIARWWSSWLRPRRRSARVRAGVVTRIPVMKGRSRGRGCGSDGRSEAVRACAGRCRPGQSRQPDRSRGGMKPQSSAALRWLSGTAPRRPQARDRTREHDRRQRPSKAIAWPDRVNPAMKAVKPSRGHPAPVARSVEASLAKLRRGDDPVLTSRDPGHQLVGVGGFLSHTDTKPPTPGE